MKNNKHLIQLSLSIALLASCPQAVKGSTIQVVNENDCSLSMTIIPENIAKSAAYCAKSIPGTSERPKENFGTFTILPEHIHGGQYFAVDGRAGGIAFGSTCRNLDVSKDYKILFHNDYLGTTCEALEIAPVIVMMSVKKR